MIPPLDRHFGRKLWDVWIGMAATAWWTQAPEKKGIERQFNMEVDRKVSGNISKVLDMM